MDRDRTPQPFTMNGREWDPNPVNPVILSKRLSWLLGILFAPFALFVVHPIGLMILPPYVRSSEVPRRGNVAIHPEKDFPSETRSSPARFDAFAPAAQSPNRRRASQQPSLAAATASIHRIRHVSRSNTTTFLEATPRQRRDGGYPRVRTNDGQPS